MSVAIKEEKTPASLIAGRLTLLALALCAASFMTSFSSNEVQNWVFISLGTLFAANLLLVLWFRLSPNSSWLKRVQSILDIGIVTGIIFSTGGVTSPYLFLYLPVVFLARIAGSLRHSIATAIIATLAYLAVAYFGSHDIISSSPQLRALITQVIILSASITLVVVGAQYLMLTIRSKEALVTKSKLDLQELSLSQIYLLEKLPYGVITIRKDLSIVRANKRASQLLQRDSTMLADCSLCDVLGAVTGAQISIKKEKGKLFLSGLPASSFHYEFLDHGNNSDQHRFFIFQEGQSNIEADDTQLLHLEDRLRELLTSSSATRPGQLPTSSRTFIAESLVMQKVFALIERAAPTDATVLIQGESGTGKELVARALHENSLRASGAFVTVNCGAIPESLIESTLFGHKKGAFTGAVTDAVGLIREAQGGTLFLDEIGELPLHMQAKLLRVLQEKTVRAVGGDRDVEVEVRVVAATNKNLRDGIENGSFRDDLYYRLNVITIPLPALRERKEDLPVLIHSFLRRLSEKAGLESEVSIASDAMHFLLNYNYPGNVRELENILERAFVLGNGQILGEHLGELPLVKTTHSGPDLHERSPTQIIEAPDIVFPLSLDEVLASIERKCITLALEKSSGHRTKAAELLGINLRSFRYRAQKLGL